MTLDKHMVRVATSLEVLALNTAILTLERRKARVALLVVEHPESQPSSTELLNKICDEIDTIEESILLIVRDTYT